LKIKKGYIYLTIIAVSIYSYLNYKESKEEAHYTKVINNMLTDIRREDYFVIHSKLSDDLKNRISIEDIKKYCQAIELNKKSSFELKKMKKNDNNITLLGIVKTDTLEQELHTTLKESNNSIKFLSQKIGKVELKAQKLSFPLTTSNKKTKVAN